VKKSFLIFQGVIGCQQTRQTTMISVRFIRVQKYVHLNASRSSFNVTAVLSISDMKSRNYLITPYNPDIGLPSTHKKRVQDTCTINLRQFLSSNSDYSNSNSSYSWTQTCAA